MTESFSSIKIRTLESRLGYLTKEYEAANQQIARTLSDVDRLRIQRQIAALEDDIREVEAELRQVAAAEPATASSIEHDTSWPVSSPSDRNQINVHARGSAVAIGDHSNAVNTSLDLKGASIGTLLLHGEIKSDARGGAQPGKSALPQVASTTTSSKGEAGASRPAGLRVFVSYASEDRSAVREVYARLMAQNYEVWFDDENLLPGQDWQVEIRKAVRSAHAIVLFLSKRTVAKAGYIQKEIKYALDVADEQPEGAIFLIPVKLEDCEIPDRLRHLQWVNLYDERGWARLMAALDRRATDLGILSGSS